MAHYKIAYIDEEQDAIDDFNSYFDNFDDNIEVMPVLPNGKEVEEIVNEVLANNCDVVAIDFYLKYEDSGVLYDGDELLIRIKERKLNLPLLLFTSERKKAEKGFVSLDTLICDKSEINDIDNPTFKNKMIGHITFYKELNKKYKTEFAELRLKQENGEKLNGKEKKRIIELNNLLEETGDRQLIIEPIENQEERLSQINLLIEKTQEIIDKLPKMDE